MRRMQCLDEKSRPEIAPDASSFATPSSIGEAQLSLILNNVSDIIFAIAVERDGDFRFISVNRRFLEATGLTEAEVVGARVRDVIPASAHELVFGKYDEAIRTGQPVHWEEVSPCPAGVKIGHVTVVPVPDSGGVYTGEVRP